MAKKKKKKKSGDGMSEFFKVNGEKIGFGVIAFIALLLIIFSIIGNSYPDKFTLEEYSPQELVDAAEKADDKIESREPQDLFDETIKDRVKNKSDLNKSDFPIKPFNAILKNQKPKRGDPPLYAVESLEVTPVRAAICVNPGGTSAESAIAGVDPKVAVVAPIESEVTGRYYVIVKGLIPYAKQSQTYTDMFKNAIQIPLEEDGKDGTFRNQPVYKFYNIQRAELKLGEEKIDWKNVKILDAKAEVAKAEIQERKQWAAKYLDLVHESLLLPGITPLASQEIALGLPPILQRTWTEAEVNHSALIEANRKAWDPAAVNGQPEQPMNNDTLDDLGILTQPRSNASQPIHLADPVQGPALSQRLFRYLDYSVVPGKQYVYRVQLIVKNPNYDPNSKLGARFIAKDEFNKNEFRTTDWSEPSPVAKISPDENVLVASITNLGRKSKAYDEPQVALDCVQWLANDGYYISKNYFRIVVKGRKKTTFTAMRGDLLNVEAPANYLDPKDGTAQKNNTMGVATKNILLDYRGGDNLQDKRPKELSGVDEILKFNPPAKVLVYNSDGQLVIHYPDVDNARRTQYGLPAVATGDGDLENELNPNNGTGRPNPKKPDTPNIFD